MDPTRTGRQSGGRVSVTISWTSFGRAAARCLARASADFCCSERLDLLHPIVAFDDPSHLFDPRVDVSLVVLSGDSTASLATLERALDRLRIGTGPARNVRAIRLAWLLDRAGARPLRKVRAALQAHGFTVFSCRPGSGPGVRLALHAITGALWTPGLACIDYMDILTLLTRRCGMEGFLSEDHGRSLSGPFSGDMAEEGPAGGVLVAVFADDTVCMQTLATIGSEVTALIPESWDAKLFVLNRHPDDPVLASAHHQAVALWSRALFPYRRADHALNCLRQVRGAGTGVGRGHAELHFKH